MKKVLIIMVVILLLLITGFLFVYRALGKVKYTTIDKSDEALGIVRENPITITPVPETEITPALTITPTPTAAPSAVTYNDEIINIALFGVDRRNKNENGRSDSTMILTIDFKNNKIKMSSLMRDMYVAIDGHGYTKLGHAYSYGGAQLAIKTINENFGTDIRDYVTVDFFTLEKTIDVLGGVSVDVKEDEISLINGYMNEVATIEGTGVEKITEPGLQVLNGRQAVAYARIRYVGNGDFERTERQRTVLTALFEAAKNKGITAVPGLLTQILPLVETSMDRNSILGLAVLYFNAGEMTIEGERYPVDGYYKGDMSTGIYYLKFDEEATKQQVQDFIYNDIKPVPKKK